MLYTRFTFKTAGVNKREISCTRKYQANAKSHAELSILTLRPTTIATQSPPTCANVEETTANNSVAVDFPLNNAPHVGTTYASHTPKPGTIQITATRISIVCSNNSPTASSKLPMLHIQRMCPSSLICQ